MVSPSKKACVLVDVLPADKQFMSPNSLPQPQFLVRCISIQIHRRLPGAQALGLYPQILNSLHLQRLTVPKHTGAALQLLEIPLDFSSSPYCAGVYISIWDISISTRFKVWEYFLPYAYTRLSWAGSTANDPRMARLWMLGRMNLRKEKKNIKKKRNRKFGISQEWWRPCCWQEKAMAHSVCFFGSSCWFKISARGYCNDETVQSKLLLPWQRTVYLFGRGGLISAGKVSCTWSQDLFPLSCWNTKPSSCLSTHFAQRRENITNERF